MGVIRTSPGSGQSVGILQDMTSQLMQLQAAGVLGPTQITSQALMDVLDRMLERKQEKEREKERKEAQKKAETGQWIGAGMDLASMAALLIPGVGPFASAGIQGAKLAGGGGGSGVPYGQARYY